MKIFEAEKAERQELFSHLLKHSQYTFEVVFSGNPGSRMYLLC